MAKILAAALSAFAAVTVADTCNPLNTKCPPNAGLANSTYTVDFTKQSSVPSEWTLSNYANLNFGSKGAEFTVAKRFDSPQLWTNFYIHYGKVEIVAQVAPGTGIVSSAGITGNYDRGSFFTLTWSVDGTVVRTLNAADTDNGSHQYPQTPAKFQLGIWVAGDPGNAWAPFTMYVKSVKITNYNPAHAYNYTDNSGSSNSIKYVSKPVVSSSSTTTQASSSSTASASVPVKAPTICAGVPPSAPTQNGIISGCTQWYTAKSGDTCLKIATKFNISNEQLCTRKHIIHRGFYSQLNELISFHVCDCKHQVKFHNCCFVYTTADYYHQSNIERWHFEALQ
ncbi:unnamed protein product [Aureobasidium uvarum]|uniref:Concanavalin A-like lectin/glucanase n=1 Tax=Aureobasidium uvarum TaxID=2773716 RepID=A0A9N8KMH1_9PEZI|nr:unnamed protein product [Aureobasidium uvarum]